MPICRPKRPTVKRRAAKENRDYCHIITVNYSKNQLVFFVVVFLMANIAVQGERLSQWICGPFTFGLGWVTTKSRAW